MQMLPIAGPLVSLARVTCYVCVCVCVSTFVMGVQLVSWQARSQLVPISHGVMWASAPAAHSALAGPRAAHTSHFGAMAPTGRSAFSTSPA